MSSPNRCRRALALAGCALLVLPLVALGASPVDAQTNVTTAQQLRDATAADAAVIVLGADITLDCATGPLAIDSATTLRSSSTTAVRTLTVDGGCRIIEVTGNVALTIERLHLTGGRAPNGSDGGAGAVGTAGGHGGAIRSDGAVTVTDSRFTDNRAGHGGDGGNGGVDQAGGNGGNGGSGGAIAAAGTVTATRTSFTNNHAGDGGAGGNGGTGTPGTPGEDSVGGTGGTGALGGNGGNGGNGGAVYTSGSASITRSTFATNTAGDGGNGGIGGTGGQGGNGDGDDGEEPYEGGQGGDAGTGGAGGDGGDGGATFAASITIATSTIHQNEAGAAGSGGLAGSVGEGGSPGGTAGTGVGAGGGSGDAGTGGAVASQGTINAVSSTITANTATEGDAARSLSAVGAVTLNHTVVAGTGTGVDCLSPDVTATNSVAGDTTCTGATEGAEGSLNLGPLANNGGPTQTRLPAANSSLVNTGAAACPETTDQRGFARKQGANCDIGAVERRGALTATVTGAATGSPADIGDDATVTFTVAIGAASTGILNEADLVPTITGCTSTPVRSGSPPPYAANASIVWTCTVTADTATTVNVTYAATVSSDEGTTIPLNATVPVQFQAPATTTTVDPTTTTSIPIIQPDAGAAGTGVGGDLPRTGLSILLVLATGVALVFGGSSMSKVAKARAEKSPRWNVKYGVPYPAGTHKQRTRDDQI
jgi:hypothetical protein